MPNQRLDFLRQYGAAVLAVALATMVRLLLNPYLGERIPFVTFFVAVVFAAWYGGLGPALMATFLSALASAILFIPPGGLAIADISGWVGLAAFLVVGLGCAFLGELMHSARNRAEQSAAEASRQHDQLRLTLASIGDAVIVTDTAGNITSLNAVAESLTGWNSQQACGEPLETVFHIVNEETRQAVENPATRALREGLIVGLANHTILISKDGTQRPIDDSAAPIIQEDGGTTGAVLVFRDIAERREAERKRADDETRIRSVVNHVVDGIITIDESGTVESCNPAAEHLFGYHAQDIIGRNVNMLMPEPFRSEHDGYLANYIRTGQAKIIGIGREVVGRRQDGSTFPMELAVSEFMVEGQRYFTGIVRDITERRDAEEKLQYQLDLNRSITDNATTAILMIDNQSRCTFMNPAAEAMTGFTFEEANGQILHDLIHHTRPDGSPYPMPECPIDRALPEKSDVHDHEDVFIRKNGELFPVRCNARPIQDDESPGSTVIEVRDLTQQKFAAARLRESEARFEQLADAIPQLAWMANPDGHLDWYNHRWYQYTGTTFAEMEGWGWQSVHDPEVLPQVVERWQASLKTGERFDMVFPLRRADGQFRSFLTRAVPFRDHDGNLVRWFGTCTDISEQQQVQEELRNVAARLSDADRRKDEFLATLAHELRNPLAPIRTGLELMKRMPDDPAKREQLRQTMERQTEQMVHLIDDLLDVSRITRGKLQLRLRQVELADVVRCAVEETRAVIDEAGHELTVTLPERPILMEADPTRLAQVLSNLLNNASKYTLEPGHICLTAEPHGSEVAVAVKDTGLGIPPEMRTRIFEMFGQIDRSVEKGYTGLGIGLMLVKTLTEMHGGTIGVHSEGAGRGSEFTLRLPILSDMFLSTVEADQDEKAAVPTALRVLVVDDNTDAADMLSTIVQMFGNEIRTAYDGQQAIEVAAEFLPDVILMDLGMPKMNGYEAALHIRKQPWGDRMVLVALTGWGQEEDKQRTKQAGFDHHLVKPAEPDAVQELLANHQPKSN